LGKSKVGSAPKCRHSGRLAAVPKPPFFQATRKRYIPDESARVFRKIRLAAGLPDGMTFTGFRHGSATDRGDYGIEDIRRISGHITLGQTTVYNEVTEKRRGLVKFEELALRSAPDLPYFMILRKVRLMRGPHGVDSLSMP
jgi:integrase